jgi:hypothetical protein
MNECTSATGHFNSHGHVTVQYRWHRPMHHVQGYIGSHWTPPSGDYSLRIVPAAGRATANKTKMQNVSTLLTISMAMGVRRYYIACTAQWRRSMAFIKATKRRHWVSTCSNSINWTHLPLIVGVYFIVKLLKKSSSCPKTIGGVTHQTDEKPSNNMSEYFVGVVNIAFNHYNNRFVLHFINQLSP